MMYSRFVLRNKSQKEQCACACAAARVSTVYDGDIQHVVNAERVHSKQSTERVIGAVDN